MSVTVVENLVREFKKHVRDNYKGYENNPPLPPLPKVTGFSGIYVVKGINPDLDQYYSKLNDTIVIGLKEGMSAAKRVILKTGEVKRDSDGKIVREPVSIPRGMIAVLTTIPLGLPFGYRGNEELFRYVDFFEPGDGGTVETEGDSEAPTNPLATGLTGVPQRMYMYLISQKYLYEFHQIALVYSNKKLSRTYITVKFQTWRNGVVYLSLIPYENNTYKKARVIFTGTISEFNKVIPKVVDHWVKVGFICNPSLFKESDIGEAIVLQQLDGNLQIPTEGLKLQSLEELKGTEMVDEGSLFDLQYDD